MRHKYRLLNTHTYTHTTHYTVHHTRHSAVHIPTHCEITDMVLSPTPVDDNDRNTVCLAFDATDNSYTQTTNGFSSYWYSCYCCCVGVGVGVDSDINNFQSTEARDWTPPIT